MKLEILFNESRDGALSKYDINKRYYRKCIAGIISCVRDSSNKFFESR